MAFSVNASFTKSISQIVQGKAKKEKKESQIHNHTKMN